MLPHEVTALTGSCVLMPCTFNVSNFEEKLQKTKFIYGVWLKGIPHHGETDSFIAFNSSQNIIRGFSHIQMIGNLTECNCTTVFCDIMKNHSDIYYFRLEMEPDVFKASFNINPVRITVTDSPQPPDLKPRDLEPVMEGSTVNLTCSAEAPCPKQPPTLSWSDIPESANITTQLQENPDKTQSVFSQMIFKASYMDHRKNISCTVTYPRHPSNSTVKSNMMLQVQFPPKETQINIKPSASVFEGTNVTLTCKSKASPSNTMNYTWYKRGQDSPLDWGKKMSFIATQIKTGWYFCTAQNQYGNQTSQELQLIVEGQNKFSKHVIYGCTGGVLALLLFPAVFFYLKRTKTVSQPSVIVSDQVEDLNTDMLAIYSNSDINKKSEITDQNTDELHYGEIDFSKLKTDHMTGKDFNHDKDPETEYAEELYAQVKNLHV